MTTDGDTLGPVVVTADFRPAEGAHARVLAALTEAIPLVHDEPGCELYSIQRRDDGSFFMIEKWSSAELLDEHGSSPAVRELSRRLSGLLERPLTVERLTPVVIGSPDKGAL